MIITALTIKDIAAMSGVGISTVSRVMNNSGTVSEATRKKVMDVVNEYNYVPNSSARNLKISQANIIALLVKGITNPFFNKMIRVIEREVALRGYTLLIQNIDNAMDEIDIAIHEVKDRNLCGVMLMGGSFSYTEEKFRKMGVPCVLITISAGDKVDKSLYSSITVDDEKEGFKATEYLISLGHRRIGFLYHSTFNENTPNDLRYKGYLRALEEYRIDFDQNLVARNAIPDESGYSLGFKCMKHLYSKNKDMTAVVTFADILAIGAAKAIFSMGLNVPQDISVVGFDGIEIAEFYNPSIDTIYQPAKEMALSSVAAIFDMINGLPSQHIVYDGVLLKRGSCKSINKED